MNYKDNINKQVIVLPTSAVMQFYFRQVGVITEIVECQGDVNFYRVKFPVTEESKRLAHEGMGFEVVDSPYINAFFGAFPTEANFLKFI